LWSCNAGLAPEKTFRAEGFNSAIGSVLFDGSHVYGVSLYGELCGLDAATGRRLWTSLALTGETTPPDKDKWLTAFLVPNNKQCFIFTDKGDLQIGRLSSAGYELLDKTHLLDPDMPLAARKVIWSHPAFANRCIFVRSNSEIVAFSLAAKENKMP